MERKWKIGSCQKSRHLINFIQIKSCRMEKEENKMEEGKKLIERSKIVILLLP
jgi:hypothetical protein